MISEFQQLSQKIDQLAELTQSLRRENAELRLKVTSLTADNAAATERREEAYRRVAALLEQIPAADVDNAAGLDLEPVLNPDQEAA